MNLCRELTIEEFRYSVVWRAQLNDGSSVFQKDIEGEEPSWISLKRFLDDNSEAWIDKLYFSFRDHIELVGENSKIFFFSRKILAHSGSEHQQHFYLGGVMPRSSEDLFVKVKHYVIPELIEFESDWRNSLHFSNRKGIIVHPELRHNFEDYYGEKI